MTIDMANFTPIASLVGGAMIGLAALLMMLTLGRIMGVSGIAAGALTGPDRAWRIVFLVGVIAAPLLYANVFLTANPVVTTNTGRLIAAGLIVGVGTRIGGGCTSGHGICGLSRLSLRSAVAVLTFMTAAIAVVALGL